MLTVTKAGDKRQPGTVGKALPGIELKILEPDNDGIGEVVARGPNVMAGYFQDREATEAMVKEGWLHTGDLGRLDADGQLFLVGRKKDVIIDANGKNVFPDELEELYGAHAHVKELSVVGLPDDSGGEKVACLCVPDYKDRPPDEVRRELEEHFRLISADQPFYRRIKVLRMWDGELPRTSTRKVKRPHGGGGAASASSKVAASAEKAKHALRERATGSTQVDRRRHPEAAADVRPDVAAVDGPGLRLADAHRALGGAGAGRRAGISAAGDLTQGADRGRPAPRGAGVGPAAGGT